MKRSGLRMIWVKKSKNAKSNSLELRNWLVDSLMKKQGGELMSKNCSSKSLCSQAILCSQLPCLPIVDPSSLAIGKHWNRSGPSIWLNWRSSTRRVSRWANFWECQWKYNPGTLLDCQRTIRLSRMVSSSIRAEDTLSWLIRRARPTSSSRTWERNMLKELKFLRSTMEIWWGPSNWRFNLESGS